MALAEGDEVIAGVVYDPVREETFTAVKGQGAFLNGSPISVTETADLSRSLLSFDLGYVDEKAALAIEMLRSLWPGMYSVRMMGSAGLGRGLCRFGGGLTSSSITLYRRGTSRRA